jgi:hypothetical protein
MPRAGVLVLSKVWVRGGVDTGVADGAVRLCGKSGRGKSECVTVGSAGTGVVGLSASEDVEADANAVVCDMGTTSSMSARDECGRSGVEGHGTGRFICGANVARCAGSLRCACGVGVAAPRSAGCRESGAGELGLGVGCVPNSFWSSTSCGVGVKPGVCGRSVGCVVSRRRKGGVEGGLILGDDLRGGSTERLRSVGMA